MTAMFPQAAWFVQFGVNLLSSINLLSLLRLQSSIRPSTFSSVPRSICNVTSLKDYILLQQVQCGIFRDLIDSFRSTLYRGLQPVLTSLYCSNFVYFYTFNGMKAIATSKGVNATPTRDLIFGYLSGIALLLILPFLFLKISNIGTRAKSMVIVLLPL